MKCEICTRNPKFKYLYLCSSRVQFVHNFFMFIEFYGGIEKILLFEFAGWYTGNIFVEKSV